MMAMKMYGGSVTVVHNGGSGDDDIEEVEFGRSMDFKGLDEVIRGGSSPKTVGGARLNRGRCFQNKRKFSNLNPSSDLCCQ